jgi:hypothetical protein
MLPIPIFMLAAPTDITTVGNSLFPLIIAALLLDVAIVAVWYFIGLVINNEGVRESAKGEYYQFIGTVLLIVIVVWGISAYSGLSYTIMNANTNGLMSQTALTALCANVENSNTLNLVGASNSLLTGAQTPSGSQLVGICNMLDGDTLTDKINYPLAAAAVVTANLTAQTANNLNGAFTYDAYIGFLSQLQATISLCIAPTPALQCNIPGGALIGTYWRTTLAYTPYSGESMLYNDMGALGTLLQLAFEAYVAQLLIISIVLFIWPYLLFGGIVLRSTFFTRKIGGLLIAIAIGAVVIFPTVFGIEYAVLGNGLPGTSALSPLNATYGFNVLSPANTIPIIPGNVFVDASGNTIVGNYVTNFYVQPNLQQIAMANGCWPGVHMGSVASILSGAAFGPAIGSSFSNPLAGAELADIFYLLNPVTNAGSGIVNLLSGSSTVTTGSYFLPAYCPPQGALATTLEMLNSYGVIGVTSYFLPIINLVMTLSAIIGMSGLMGGDTTLEGLSRFV